MATPLAGRLALIARFRDQLAKAGPELSDSMAETLARTSAGVMVSEIIPLADAAKFLERNGERVLKIQRLGRSGRPGWLSGVRAEIRREPLGVILVLGPRNYPLFLPGVQALQALAAGNAVIVKPGAGGKHAMDRMAMLLSEAGLPAGLFTVLQEDIEAGRAAISAGPDKVILTGAPETGNAVLRELAATPTPAVMELSGNDPFIVLDGADPDLAARATVYGLTLNGGETCIAPRRIIAVRAVAEAFQAALEEHLRDAGGSVIGADGKDGASPPFDSATVLVHDNAVLPDAPVFGPVAHLATVADTDEAIALANASDYALGASVFGPQGEAEKAARRISAGIVAVNDVIVPSADPRLPFQGRGASGFGATRGAEGLLEMTVPKAVAVRKGKTLRHLDPEHPGDAALFAGYLRLAHRHGVMARFAALRDLVRAVMTRGKSS